MYDTNGHVLHICVPGSKLTQHKEFLAEFRVDEACYGLPGWKYAVNLGYQEYWL